MGTGKRDENGHLYVPIDIQPWEDELLEEEPEITDFESVVKLRKKHSAGQVARYVGAAQARGDVEQRIANDVDTLLYQTGIEIDLNRQVTAQMETARLENGREIQIRSFVGPVRGQHDEDEGNGHDLLVDALSKKGLERAIRYFHSYVPGYIEGRLELIAANKGDVHEHAEWLIARIWEMVEELNGVTRIEVESIQSM